MIIQTNYAVLRGIIDLVQQGTLSYDLHPTRRTGTAPRNETQEPRLTPEQLASLTPAEILAMTDGQFKTLPMPDMTPDQRDAVTDREEKYRNTTRIPISPTDDRPHCSQFEESKFADFKDSYRAELKDLLMAIHKHSLMARQLMLGTSTEG